MLQTIDEELPARWQGDWWVMDSEMRVRKERLQAMHGTTPDDDIIYSLQGWLEEIYFDGTKVEDLGKADIRRIGALIRRMLRLEPSVRAPARDVLQDCWQEKH